MVQVHTSSPLEDEVFIFRLIGASRGRKTMSDWISPQDLQETQHWLDKVFTEVSEQEGTLAGGNKLGIGAKAIQELRATKVYFGDPRNEMIQLNPRLLNDIGIQVTALIKHQMQKQFNFYYMTLTVSMRTGKGVQFKQLKCNMEFGSGESESPIIHAIFPTSKRKDILYGEIGMHLGGEATFEGSAELDATALLNAASIPGQVRVKVASRNTVKAFLTIPGYSFNLSQKEITAMGEGSPECYWSFEKPVLRGSAQVKFGVIFKVPKDATSATLTGLVVVEPDTRWLANSIRHVFGYLSASDQELIQRSEEERQGKERIPIGDHEQWSLTLPQ
jgi:hypothetical protein